VNFSNILRQERDIERKKTNKFVKSTVIESNEQEKQAEDEQRIIKRTQMCYLLDFWLMDDRRNIHARRCELTKSFAQF
jgi:hypothetical protein